MKSRKLICLAAMTLLVALADPIRAAAQDQQEHQKWLTHYTVNNLGALGGTASNALGVNNKGWVTGVANLTGDTAEHASLWRDGFITDLGTLGGVNSNLDFPIKNDSGLLAGFAQTSTVDPLGENFCIFICTSGGGRCEGSNLTCQGFRWRDGAMTALPMLGGNNSAAISANNMGMIVGVAENNTQDPNCIPPQVLDYEAVIWGPLRGEIHELPAFSGDSIGAAVAINDKGQIVGGSGSCGSGPGIGAVFNHAVLWQDGSVSDLGNLGGVMNNLADAINDRGQVVGISDLPGDTSGHAFLWQNGSMTDLGTLAGDFSSAAFGINNKGQVVGLSCDQTGNCRAFLWQNGVMTDINSLVSPGSSLYLVAGQDINAAGEIVGEAFDQNTGEVLAFSAVPCGREHPASDGCMDGALGTSVVLDETGERPKVVLPDNIRQQLRQRLRFGRFGVAPASGVSNPSSSSTADQETLSCAGTKGATGDTPTNNGHCAADNNWTLTGACLSGHYPNCVDGFSPQACPKGAPVRNRGTVQCSIFGRPIPVDLARPCSFP